MAGKGISLNFLADVRDFLKGTSSVEDALDDVGTSLDDLTRDASQATDAISRDLDDTARAGDQAGEKLEDSFRDAFDAAAREANTGMDKVRTQVDDGLDATTKSGRAAEAGTEIGQEFGANIGEAIGSGQANIADILQGTLGGLVSVPGIGLAAAGIGIGVAVIKGISDRIASGKAELAEAVQTVFDSIEVDASSLTVKWDRAKLLDSAIDSLTEGGRTEDLQRVVEWGKAGIGEDTIARALVGELTAEDLASLEKAADQVEKVTGSRGEERIIVTDTAKKAQEVLDLAEKQQKAVETSNVLAGTLAGLYQSQAENIERGNRALQNRPQSPEVYVYGRPVSRWED